MLDIALLPDSNHVNCPCTLQEMKLLILRFPHRANSQLHERKSLQREEQFRCRLDCTSFPVQSLYVSCRSQFVHMRIHCH